jgi:ATP-dependent Clp protease, protease subunit
MILHLTGTVNKKMLLQVIEFLQDNPGDVIVRITSHGGDADVALAIAGLLVNHTGFVTTEIYGQCFSAATIIFAVGSIRRMQKYAWVMVHEGSQGVTGTASAIKYTAKQMERSETNWNAILQERTGTEIKAWEKLNERDTYLTADECLKLNLATETF